MAKKFFTCFNINMNLVNSTILRQNLAQINNWIDSTSVSGAIDSVTYDLYESNNPFRKKFTPDEIQNKGVRVAANAGTAVSAELFSAFTNPYYLTHKITQIPTLYNNVADVYRKNRYVIDE